jgi:hypothetical protein
MPPVDMNPIVGTFCRAALTPNLWPIALREVVMGIGAVGAWSSIWDKTTAQPRWMAITGPFTSRVTDYIDYFYAQDPLHAPVDRAPIGTWVRATRAIAPEVLKKSEWYNDLLLGSGIDDLVCVCLFEDTMHRIYFGMHHGIGDPPLGDITTAVSAKLLHSLRDTLELQATSLGAVAPTAETNASALRPLATRDHDGRKQDWRNRAQQLRKIAATISDVDVRQRLMDAAKTYDTLAEKAEKVRGVRME